MEKRNKKVQRCRRHGAADASPGLEDVNYPPDGRTTDDTLIN